MPNYLCNGCLCCYDTVDCDSCKFGCIEVGEFLCLTSGFCLALGAKPYGCCSFETEPNECCKIQMFCCEIGLKSPETLCAGASQLFCLKDVVSFPFSDDYVKEPVCAFCCIACAPEGGCMKQAPTCPAIDRF